MELNEYLVVIQMVINMPHVYTHTQKKSLFGELIRYRFTTNTHG